MSRHATWNLGLLLTFFVLVAASFVLGADPSEKNVEVLPGMVDSVPYDAFAPNPVFADGKTLQRPPAGTIARGTKPLHYGPGPQEAVRAGEELTNPLRRPADLARPATLDPSDPDAAAVRDAYEATLEQARADLARGEEVYAVYCRVCHGDSGMGDGPVAKRGFPAPASLLGERALTMPDGQMFHLVTHGGENMPSYAAQVNREDRWKSILYIRTLQEEGLAAGLALPPGDAAQAPVEESLDDREVPPAPRGIPEEEATP